MRDSKQSLAVLLIDDDTDDALIVRHHLKKSGSYSAQVTTASSYQNALRELENHVFDVCLVDYRLSAKNGLELISELSHTHEDTAFILLTGQGDEELGIRALRSGAEDYLMKSELTPALLERSIRYAIERKATKDRLANLVESEIRREEAKRSEREITNIIESFSDAFMVLSLEGGMLYLNTQATEYLHKPQAELLGKILWEVYPHAKKGELYSGFQRALETQQTQTVEYHSTLNKKWFQASIYPYPDKIAVHFTDVTTRKEVEQRKDEFISIAGHELKTPLTSVKAYLQYLQLQFQRNNLTKHLPQLQKMNAQIDRLSTLISDLLDVTKIQQGKLEYTDSAFDLQELVSTVVEDVQQTTPTHQITVEQNDSGVVCADHSRISQVLINFLTNAIKYSPAADAVSVRSVRKNGTVTVTVRDFGPGISKRHHAEIFHRFYRVNTKESKSLPGMGIGLYISNQIIHHYHGEIGVQSAPGKGSTFFFSLPLKQD